MFTNKDHKQIKNKGIAIEQIEKQLQNFKTGFPPIKLVKVATKEHGIKVFDDNEITELVRSYTVRTKNKEILKFVPASGAASRMFKNLLNFLNLNESEQKEELKNDNSFNSAFYFFKQLQNFAFHNKLENILKENNIDIKDANYNAILKYFLTKSGMDYSELPKALLHFHKYKNGARTSIEEHLVEAAKYSTSKGNIARIHFTLSEEHISDIKNLFNEVIPLYEKEFNLKYEINFSVQNQSTDTIAVNLINKPFRLQDGSILFRPGGHGALIDNLNNLDADIIFIKNIDNVVPDRLKAETIKYKKVIGAHLIYLQQKLFDFLKKLEKDESGKIINDIIYFFEKELMFIFPENFKKINIREKIKYLKTKLKRPIRICGMVKNEGEPGGGPFWVKNEDGSVSLQIIEASQINTQDKNQLEILSNSTHFNPVDLVCTTKDHNGNKFDLKKFIDHETGFISQKSKDGKDLLAQELPGLWNGAMADWNTVFVEVPLITFNPVKYINDLLREQHQ